MDREQISELYHRLGPLIYRRCLKLLRNPESAREAMQEVFVRMLRNKAKLTDDRQCLPWLYRVATNYCLNVIRDGSRLEFREQKDLPVQKTDPTAEKRVLAREEVFSLLTCLDDKTRQIAVYKHVDGMTQAEIARVMGISRKTIGKKLNLFMQKAREPAGLKRVS
jgi:RNA polymerase sigma-70 factor, ECF subfamily